MATQLQSIEKKVTVNAFFPKEELKKIAKDPANKSGKDLVVCYVNAVRAKQEVNRQSSDQVNYKFFGTFEFVNAETGEAKRANTAYLPGIGENAILEHMEPSESEEGILVGAVVTAFIIGVMPDSRPNSAMGYKFTLKTMVDKEQADPFAGLREKVSEAKKAVLPKK